jgi:hypothetical protein
VPGAGVATGIEWGEWSVGAPTSFSYSLGTSAFGNDVATGTVLCPSSDCNIIIDPISPVFGYNVYDVTVGIPNILLAGGATRYWLTISNATDAASDGTQAWDDNGSPSATCEYRKSPGPSLPCGSGTTSAPPQPQAGDGEAFTIIGSQATTPEPSSIMLFGSGILGLAGILRRKVRV